MGGDTKIQWADKTWSPWRGCTKVAPGCKNCYADALSKRNPATLGVWGDNGTRVVNANWQQVRTWNKTAELGGYRISVFPSLCDPFEDWGGSMYNHQGEELPFGMAEFRQRFFALIDKTPWIDWLVLTKRPENIPTMTPPYGGPPGLYFPPLQSADQRHNLHLIASVSEQETVERNVPLILRCRPYAATIGISAEPLLGPIDLEEGLPCGISRCSNCGYHYDTLHPGSRTSCNGAGCGPIITQPPSPSLDWVIVGGESGKNARPCDLEWIESIRDQCREHETPVFIKQMGSNHWCETPDLGFQRVEFEDSKGGDWSIWPEELRIREYPDALK